MILTCPSCSAKFMISSEALGHDGREVRCGKCGHLWFQHAERDSLDDLHDTPLADDVRQPAARARPNVERSVPDAIKPNKDKEKPTYSTITPPSKLRHVAAVMTALAVVSIVFLVLFLERNSISASYPLMGKAYEEMGLHLKQEKAPFAFDHIKLSRQGGAVSVKGILINLTGQNTPVKSVTIDFLDQNYKPVVSKNISLGTPSLKPEAEQKIDAKFENIPANVMSVKLHVD